MATRDAQCPSRRRTVLGEPIRSTRNYQSAQDATYLTSKLLSERWAFLYPLRVHARIVDNLRYFDPARRPKSRMQD